LVIGGYWNVFYLVYADGALALYYVYIINK